MLDVDIGTFGVGDSFDLPLLFVRGVDADFRQLAWLLVRSALLSNPESWTPCAVSAKTRALRILVAKGFAYGDVVAPTEFRYVVPRKPPKRYPWYPASLNWDPRTELASFGLCPLPNRTASLTKRGALDVGKPHALAISGYPGALLRLAKVILDYCNTGGPEEGFSFEIEGGFRGVGLYSYPAKFELLESRARASR